MRRGWRSRAGPIAPVSQAAATQRSRTWSRLPQHQHGSPDHMPTQATAHAVHVSHCAYSRAGSAGAGPVGPVVISTSMTGGAVPGWHRYTGRPSIPRRVVRGL
jgi:hypothetical protein